MIEPSCRQRPTEALSDDAAMVLDVELTKGLDQGR